MTLALAPDLTQPLSPLERLEALCDDGTLTLFRTGVNSQRMGDRSVDSDGVITGSGRVHGRPVFCYAQDPTYLGGSVGEEHANSIVKLLGLAERAQAPIVGFIESGGARMQEGTAALAGYGRMFREQVRLSGRIPQIAVICGASAGGGSYSPALMDFVVMTERANMFLTGPTVVREVMSEDVSAQDLGGPDVHARNGVCNFVAANEVDAAYLVRDLIEYLPSGAGSALQIAPSDPPGYDLSAPVPANDRKVYDIRDVIRGLADAGRFLEFSPRWARNMVCGFARVDGRAVGIVANQPKYLGGVLCSDSATKGARFVRLCNAFGLALVVLVDTPGFLPGKKQEQGAVIRHGAKLVHAFAEASVPRVTVVLRKAFGGAFIAMNSRDLGADYVFAWPQAQLGVMGGRQAVAILNRRDIAAAPNPVEARDSYATTYAQEHLSATTAARNGFIDEVIAPDTTRQRVCDALATLGAACSPAQTKNIPL